MFPSKKGWFPAQWMKSTLPILEDPGLTTNDLQGSAFLLQYGNVNYLVTAKHVIEKLRDPMFGFHRINRKLERVSCHKFESILGLKWIYHPSGLDIAAIPFPIKPFMDVAVIEEKYWINAYKVPTGEIVTHLGYPLGLSSQYIDDSPSFFARAMIGNVLTANTQNIITTSPGAPGASGGPLFMKENSTSGLLIGIVIRAGVLNRTFVDKTISLPTYEVEQTLKSKEMQEEVKNYEKLILDILDNDESKKLNHTSDRS